MTPLIQKLYGRRYMTYADGVAMAAELQALGYQQLLLPAVLYAKPDEEDAINSMLSSEYQSREAMRELGMRGITLDVPPTTAPGIRQDLAQCLDHGTPMPQWPWHKLLQPDSELAKLFATPDYPTWDAETALAYCMHHMPLYAGLVAHWRGPVRVIPKFPGNPFMSVQEAWLWLSYNVSAIPHALAPAPEQLPNVAHALYRLGLATDILERDRLLSGVRKHHTGMATALVTPTSGYLGGRFEYDQLHGSGIELDRRSDPPQPSPHRSYWLELVARCQEAGGLYAINRIELPELGLKVALLARFYFYEPMTDAVNEVADKLLTRGSAEVNAMWDEVCQQLAALREQQHRPQGIRRQPPDPQRFSEHAHQTIKEVIAARLR